MTDLSALWLPILLAAVFCFMLSALIHMGPFWHKNDFPAVPDEEKTRAAIGPLGIPPGEYMLPRCFDHAQARSPEFVQKMTEGPVWLITVRPNGMIGMGGMLGGWFVYLLVVIVFAAYVSSHALAPGSHYLEVFRFVGTTAFMGLALAQVPNSIWYGRRWSTTIKHLLDGLIYALVTAGTFGWLWPEVVA